MESIRIWGWGVVEGAARSSSADREGQRRRSKPQPRPNQNHTNKNRILDPLRHRLAPDVVRRLRRQRAGVRQVRSFLIYSRGRERGREKKRERTINKKTNPTSKEHKLIFFFSHLLCSQTLSDTPSSTPRAGRPRRLASSKRGWSGSTPR